MLYAYTPDEAHMPKPSGVNMGHESLKINNAVVVYSWLNM